MTFLNLHHNLNIHPLLLHKVLLKFLPPPLNLHSLNPLPLNHPPSYPDAFYNSISAEILTLQAQQQSMLNSQSALLTNQSLLMEHFMNMQLKMESFDATQKEILDLLKTCFPPSPPPGSDI